MRARQADRTQQTIAPLTKGSYLKQVVIRAVLVPLGNAPRPAPAPLLVLLDLAPAAPQPRQPTTLTIAGRPRSAQSLERSVSSSRHPETAGSLCCEHLQRA